METPPLDPPDVSDDRPIAVRRKRRFSSGLVEAKLENALQAEASNDGAPTNTTTTTTTPAKLKKKVRFSDPGPDIARESFSTGLTPHLRRTSFETRARDARDSSPPRLQPQAPRRRLSMPALHRALPSPSLSPQPETISGTRQFAPLRQLLAGRVKRRIRRNGLSEEINNIDAEAKSKVEWMREIEELKKALALQREQNTQAGGNKGESNGKRIAQLEQELTQLKQERVETPTVGTFPVALHDESGIFLDDTATNLSETTETTERLSDITPVDAAPSTNEMATQASIAHPEQQGMLRQARLSLEYLFPGEIALGLIPEDPKPLLDIMLERLQRLKTDVLVAEDSLSTTQTQESNLRTQFNAVLEQLDRARRYSTKLIQKTEAEKARAVAAEERIPLMEIDVKETNEKAGFLQKESHERDRSIRKLQHSLESYRNEVTKLEDLINEQQTKHEAAMTDLREEMDEAVADLECNLHVETLGRTEAEHQVTLRDTKIKELQHREKELLATVHEKQTIIREMEAHQTEMESRQSEIESHHTELDSHRTAEHSHELGQLNVRISTLSTALSTATEQRQHAERARDVLMRKLEDEKNAGLRAIDALRAELAHFTASTEGIKAAYASDSQRRGKEVAECQGLLTPVAETRFRDIDVPGYVEGEVEMERGKGGRKGKRRPDSGVVMLEEDEEEEDLDESMADFGGFSD